jgi:hypothetical protein
MEALFTRDYWLFWMAVLALALFFPVRKLIWVLYVRRAQRRGAVDEAEKQRLLRRAGVTAAMICFVFSYFYTDQLFQPGP